MLKKYLFSRFNLPLVYIILFGAILRFTNLNWDSFLQFHPDEGYFTNAAIRVFFFNKLDPQFYIYGGLPIYIFRLLANGIGFVTGNTLWFTDTAHIALAGRIISASVSTSTILLIYFTGKDFFSRRAGLLSAFLLAVSSWAIREAHFAASENILIFFILLLTLVSRKYYLSQKRRLAVISGIILGACMGTKPTAYLVGIIPFVTLLLIPVSISEKCKKAFIIGISAFCTFFITSGYTLIHAKTAWLTITGTIADIIGRHPNAYFTLQFTGTRPFVYQFITMLWQAFLVVPSGYIGLGLLLYSAIRSKKSDYIIFLSFPLIYGLSYSLWFVKFSRYNDLLLPFITLCCSWLFADKLKTSKISIFFLSIILLTSLFWGVANWNIYNLPQTRIEASAWIYKTIPSGSLLCREDTDETLPLSINSSSEKKYSIDILRVYDPESDQKFEKLTKQLHACDYLVFATRRVWGTMPHLTVRYPRTAVLYKYILNEKAGFTEIQRFTSYPQLGPIIIPDDASEETNQIFDHPTIRIFKKTSDISPEMLSI